MDRPLDPVLHLPLPVAVPAIFLAPAHRARVRRAPAHRVRVEQARVHAPVASVHVRLVPVASVPVVLVGLVPPVLVADSVPAAPPVLLPATLSVPLAPQQVLVAEVVVLAVVPRVPSVAVAVVRKRASRSVRREQNSSSGKHHPLVV
ncbi:hypothetical protein GCM10009563_15900 [Subtercola frigoramans]